MLATVHKAFLSRSGALCISLKTDHNNLSLINRRIPCFRACFSSAARLALIYMCLDSCADLAEASLSKRETSSLVVSHFPIQSLTSDQARQTASVLYLSAALLMGLSGFICTRLGAKLLPKPDQDELWRLTFSPRSILLAESAEVKVRRALYFFPETRFVTNQAGHADENRWDVAKYNLSRMPTEEWRPAYGCDLLWKAITLKSPALRLASNIYRFILAKFLLVSASIMDLAQWRGQPALKKSNKRCNVPAFITF